MKNKLGIYIHVPFCAAKCSYCDFYSLSGKLEQRDAYVERLLTELVQQSSACQDYTVDTVYFGGGTPSLLGGARIARIVDTVRAHYALEPDAEITAEANPDSMTDDFLTVSRASGVNRLSMGIQSANDRELRAIGRIHTFAQAQDAFFRARRAGFANLSVDLMYALPNQRMEQLCASLDALLDLQPEHLSCYGLTLEAHTPLGRQHPVLPAGTTVVTGSKAPISALVPAHTAILPVSDMRFRAIYPRGCAAKRSRNARTNTRLTAPRNTSCCHSGLPPVLTRSFTPNNFRQTPPLLNGRCRVCPNNMSIIPALDGRSPRTVFSFPMP